MGAGLDGSDRIVVSMKMLRAELLSVKADLERELEKAVLDCTVCGKRVHYVGGLGARAGRWAHAEPHRTTRRSSFATIQPTGSVGISLTRFALALNSLGGRSLP